MQCGLCCQNVNLAAETQFLDRGDGTCRHYDGPSKKCSIYDIRPDICRVDKQYDTNYKKNYTWDEFVNINLYICERLANKKYQ